MYTSWMIIEEKENQQSRIVHSPFPNYKKWN